MASGTMESKQDQRKILLEEYRAAQAFKRAASLGINGSEASKSAGKARTKPSSLKFASQQKNPNKQIQPSETAPQREGAALPASSSAKRTPRAADQATPLPIAALEAIAARKMFKTQTPRIFGYETSRQAAVPEEPALTQPELVDSTDAAAKQPAQDAGPSTSAGTLGPAFVNTADSFSGIKWHIRMEKLRLEQWKILNSRTRAAFEKQEELADAQIHLAAEAVIAIKKQAFEKETRGELKIQSEHAAEVLAAQIPRLELYASIKDDHETSLDVTARAIEEVMNQMPLVNGAICGDLPEAVDSEGILMALQDVQRLVAGYMPRIEPFQANTQASSVLGGQPGFDKTAAAAERLAEENDELEGHLLKNAALLRSLEHEMLHAQSLSMQLLQT